MITNAQLAERVKKTGSSDSAEVRAIDAAAKAKYGTVSSPNNFGTTAGAPEGYAYNSNGGLEKLATAPNVVQTPLPASAIGAQPVTLPTPPTSDNMNSLLTSNNAALANPQFGLMSDGKGGFTIQTNGENGSNSYEDIFKQYIGLQTPPPSTADIYAKEAAAAGIKEKQQLVNNYTAQLNGIVAKSTADQLAVTGQGRGIPEVIIGGQQAQISKEAAIQALPVQAQLAAAQGNLELAQDHLDTMFKLKSADALAQYDYKNKVIDTVFQFATKQEERRLEDLKTENDRKYKQEQDNLALINDWSKMAVSNGKGNLLTDFAKINPKSPTFQADLAKVQSKIKVSQADNGFTLSPGQTRYDANGNVVATAGGDSADVTADLDAYGRILASTGKMPSPAELKMSGLTAGQVANYAKELPKESGLLVDRNTGIKATLDPTKETGIIALRDAMSRLDRLKELYNKQGFGGVTTPFSKDRAEFETLKNEFSDLLARARSGAALTEFEQAEYMKKIPNPIRTFSANSANAKLDALKSSMETRLNSNLEATGTAIYGYSKVKIGDQDYTIGDVISNSYGTARVNPDGTVTQIIDTSENKPTSRADSDVIRVASAIGQFESGGNYKAIGPDTGNGNRAYGKYQVMASNIPQWTKEALGKSLTPQQFLADPKAQDAVAHYKMGKLLTQYGNVEDVASVWFSGRPLSKAGNAKDVIGTTVPNYAKRVRQIYNQLG